MTVAIGTRSALFAAAAATVLVGCGSTAARPAGNVPPTTGPRGHIRFTIGGKAPSTAAVAYVASTDSSASGSPRLLVLSHNASLPYRVTRPVDPTVTRYTINAAPRGKGNVGCQIRIGAYSDSGTSGPSSLCTATLLWSARLGHWVDEHPARHPPTPPPRPRSGPYPLARAFVNPGGSMAGGLAVLGIGRGTGLNFVQSGRFQLGLALRESASQPVTLTDVRAVFPHGSVLRQLGTALAPQNPMFPCGISKPRRFGALRATRLPVAPRKYACVQLNFQFLGCPAARHASLRDVRMLDVSYRTRAGAVIRQRVGLGDAHLLIVPTVESPLLSDRWARRVVHPCGR